MQSTKSQAYRLSPRLQAIAGLVPVCRRILDIGTDHAWLPVELIRSGRCQEGLAIDIRPGPLAIAARNIQGSGLAGQVKTSLNDGLQGIGINPDDVIVVAGLGGYETMRVLGEEPRRCQAIILQPMKSLPELRIWLGQHGYAIDNESLVLEPKHAYIILSCHYTGENMEFDRLSALVGPCLLQKWTPELLIYLRRLLPRLARQKRGDPELVPVISQIEKIAAELEASQIDLPGGC